MKKIVNYFLLIALMTSCKKNSDSKQISTPPEQTISYKRNGVFREFKKNQDYFKISNSTVNTFAPYTLMYNVSAFPNNEESISLFIISTTTSQLKVGDYYCQYPIQYTQPSGSTVRFSVANAVFRVYSSSTNYVVKEYEDASGDFSKVKITSIENGYASGTFSASTTLINGTEKLNITEGVFTNFKMN